MTFFGTYQQFQGIVPEFSFSDQIVTKRTQRRQPLVYGGRTETLIQQGPCISPQPGQRYQLRRILPFLEVKEFIKISNCLIINGLGAFGITFLYPQEIYEFTSFHHTQIYKKNEDYSSLFCKRSLYIAFFFCSLLVTEGLVND